MTRVRATTALPVAREIAGHHQPAPFYLTTELFGTTVPIEIAGGDVSRLVDAPVAAPHRHPVAEVYLLLSQEPGDAEIEIVVDQERHRLVSPGAFLVEAGALHHFVTVRAKPGSWCLGILLGDERRARRAVLEPGHGPRRSQP